jgi:hypothetical protein
MRKPGQNKAKAALVSKPFTTAQIKTRPTFGKLSLAERW